MAALRNRRRLTGWIGSRGSDDRPVTIPSAKAEATESHGKRSLRLRSPHIQNRRPMPPPPTESNVAAVRRWQIPSDVLPGDVQATTMRRITPTPGKETGPGNPPPHRRAVRRGWQRGVRRRFELWGERDRKNTVRRVRFNERKHPSSNITPSQPNPSLQTRAVPQRDPRTRSTTRVRQCSVPPPCEMWSIHRDAGFRKGDKYICFIPLYVLTPFSGVPFSGVSPFLAPKRQPSQPCHHSAYGREPATNAVCRKFGSSAPKAQPSRRIAPPTAK